jgi:hypothetical protein
MAGVGDADDLRGGHAGLEGVGLCRGSGEVLCPSRLPYYGVTCHRAAVVRHGKDRQHRARNAGVALRTVDDCHGDDHLRRGGLRRAVGHGPQVF